MRHVDGKKIGHVVAYTLSTCVWCKKIKRLMNDLGIDYYYIDVDLLEGGAREEARREVLRWNSAGSYPTIVIDDEKSINGYEPEKVKDFVRSSGR
jgi:glutaredoxin